MGTSGLPRDVSRHVRCLHTNAPDDLLAPGVRRHGIHEQLLIAVHENHLKPADAPESGNAMELYLLLGSQRRIDRRRRSHKERYRPCILIIMYT